MVTQLVSRPTLAQDKRQVSARRRWRVVVLLLGGLLLVALSVATWLARSSVPGPITTQGDLQKLPEEHLFYPGAVLLGSGGNDYERGIWGSNPAQSGHTLGVVGSKEEVLAFYDRELKARGWQWSPGDGAVGSNEIGGNAWRKDRVALQIAILRRNDPQNRPAVNDYPTAYRLSVIADRPPAQR